MTTETRARGSAVREMRTDPKIGARHLARQGRICVRQSHPNQVLRHPESARRQYGLVERAEQLGWPREQIGVIDEDQGKSAAGSAAAHGRDGFAQLVSAVGLGEVGVVLALEVSRLARNSAEWYRLLELAALTGTLIADDTTVYDPRLFNDRLLLGPRGTISEVELHCIQERLHGARMSKARRGELPLACRRATWPVAMGRPSSTPTRKSKGRSGPSSPSSSGWAPPPRCCTSSTRMGSGSPGGAGMPRPGRGSSGCGRATRRSTWC